MHSHSSPAATQRHSNNFDFLRMVAASMVLYSHHFVLSGMVQPGVVGVDTLGGLAVAIFFTLSGYLVTQSWLADPHPLRFAWRRALRIWPALVVVCLLSVLALGPLVTELPPRAYFQHEATWNYLHNLRLFPVFHLPGVFGHNASNAVNGSLWTIPLEVWCYLGLMVAGFIGALATRQTLLRTGAVLLLGYVWLQFNAPEELTSKKLVELGAFFTVGAMLFVTRQARQAHPWRWLLICAALALAAWLAQLPHAVMLVVVGNLTILIGAASTPVIRRFGRFGDFSYGIYLFAFPVQQTVLMLWPDMPFWPSMALAWALTVALAALSWHWVEKPALAFKPARAQPFDLRQALGRALRFGGYTTRTLALTLLAGAGALAWLESERWPWWPLRADLGAQPPLTFFTPQGYPPELARRTYVGQVNVESVDRLRSSLEVARAHGARLQIDFSPLLLQQRPLADIRKTYEQDGQTLPKSFATLPSNKVKNLPDDQALTQILAPYWPLLQAFREQIATIFLVDEPYMHGISREEMERGATRVRQLLQEHGLGSIPLGVTFSSAMFDARFAEQIARRANVFVQTIESHRRNMQADAEANPSHREAYQQWVDLYARQRLTTYDLAGNLYTATLLQDMLHENTLAWLAEQGVSKACRPFRHKGVTELRQHLSFYQDGPVVPDGHARDKPWLDAMLQCRAATILQLLKTHATPDVQGFQLWGESSANGFQEFDAQGALEEAQPPLLIASRVSDEVQRTLDFYARHRDDFSAGVVFFTWDDEVDQSIDLQILGAKSLPGVADQVLDRIGK